MNPFGRILLPILLGLLLANCATSSPEQLAERYKTQCINRGYQPGTDAYADCLVQVEGEREGRIDARRREMVDQRQPMYGTR